MVRPTVAAVRPAIANPLRSLCPHACTLCRGLMRYAARAFRWAGSASAAPKRRSDASGSTESMRICSSSSKTGVAGRYAPARNEIRYPGLVKI